MFSCSDSKRPECYINDPELEADTNGPKGDINKPECDTNSPECEINYPECDMDNPECDMYNPECDSDRLDDVYISTIQTKQRVEPVAETDITSERHRKKRVNAKVMNIILTKISVFLLLSQSFESQSMIDISSGKLSIPVIKQINGLFTMDITSSSITWNHGCIYVYAVPLPFVRLRYGQGQVGSNSSSPRQSSSVLDGHHHATGVQPPTTSRQMSVYPWTERRQPIEERRRLPLVGRQPSHIVGQSVARNSATDTPQGLYPYIIPYHIEVIDGRQVIRLDFDLDFIANSNHYGAICVTSDMSACRRQPSIRRQSSHLRDEQDRCQEAQSSLRSAMRRQPSDLREESTRWQETQARGHASIVNVQSAIRRQPSHLRDDLCPWSGQQSNIRGQLQPSFRSQQHSHLRDRLSVVRRARSSHREESSDRTGQESIERTIDSLRIYPHIMHYHMEEVDGRRVIRVVFTTDFLDTFHRYDIIYVSQSPVLNIEGNQTLEMRKPSN